MASIELRDDLLRRLTELAYSQGQSVDDVLASFLSQTERSQHTLHENEVHFAGIISSAMDAIISVDEDESIVVFNHSAEIMFGCSSEEALGKPLSMFIPARYRKAHHELVRHYGRTGETVRSIHSQHEIRALRSNGEEFPADATISRIKVGQKTLFTVILRDITERKQLEQLRLETETMRIALEKERELLELKRRFVSTVSHEFRTPLAMIMSSAELLERYSDRLTGDRKDECLHTIREQANEMVELMNDVLLLNKASVGKIQFRPKHIDLDLLLYAIIEHVRPMADPEIHRLVVDNQSEMRTLWADEELLKRIFVNLLTNAIKYSPAGGEVRLTVQRHHSGILFRLSDQGIGIPVEDQQHLFEPFHRAVNTRDIAGTGLGLTIVKEFVEAHRGSITVESLEGQGTTFNVLLPDLLH
jgi:PAS domain S-box-containing protein